MGTSTAKVRDMLANMGMPPHMSGFDICAEAICMVVSEPQMMRSITTRLYPVVARKFGITPVCAEKRIRAAITRMYDVSRLERIQMYAPIPCHYDSGKSTNSELIAAVARYIRDTEKIKEE